MQGNTPTHHIALANNKLAKENTKNGVPMMAGGGVLFACGKKNFQFTDNHFGSFYDELLRDCAQAQNSL